MNISSRKFFMNLGYQIFKRMPSCDTRLKLIVSAERLVFIECSEEVNTLCKTHLIEIFP